ncbi:MULTISPECIES: branched-chain amino acid transport system II carrier protein [unclassified Psychrobacillus]|uniref:branched-chain amino acid transport system II carrier protein n=1 Tax=unclassified Psychrobacillus TaxID=2636677 RepID=UPI00146C5471|nr:MULTISPECIES: branched-chain amino acid transport system II carrier protein [unclassified Psychrobacillus]MCM3357528.1 branched-chain amino acid transport system II carrier protein [Psychrobacillus sp. MER TA 171]NME04704.1 branched-chain amino acid transport system II carrier protein [Psychrobacillus sp. BL-248-WT-3]
MDNKLSFSSYLVIGIMLFALFFGAGNLIFPASLGQNAGTSLWVAIIGFLITGIGLPFLGTLAMGFSGSKNLQELSSRVHPIFAIIFTSLLYLTIGPFFALPRTGAVSYEIGIMPFINSEYTQIGLFVFTVIFFGLTLWLSLNPSKIVDNVGKYLSPGILIGLLILLVLVIFKPMGDFSAPQGSYVDNAFMTGFTEGYNTMDALASLVFGIIVINAVRAMGVTSKKGILAATAKSGAIAIFFLGVIYAGIGYLGATSVDMFGIMDTGGPVLSAASEHYFGSFGAILLAIVIILACLTTSIGLTTACAEYFNTLIPAVSYKVFVIVFSVFTCVIANFGLANIITYSVPVLMLLYPLAIVLILLAFLSPLFYHSRLVYVVVMFFTFLISIVDGLKALCESLEIEYFGWLQSILNLYDNILPFYGVGLGWVIPFIVITVITSLIARVIR